jgi:hypothetical protein
VVVATGTATATIDFQEGAPEAYFDYQFDYDLETCSSPRMCAQGTCQ